MQRHDISKSITQCIRGRQLAPDMLAHVVDCLLLQKRYVLQQSTEPPTHTVHTWSIMLIWPLVYVTTPISCSLSRCITTSCSWAVLTCKSAQ